MSTQQPFLSDILSEGPVKQYDILDFDEIRNQTMDNVKAAVQRRFPMSNERYSLELEDLDYDGSDKYSIKDQKEAILKGRSLGRKLRGRWMLRDVATGDVVQKGKKSTVLNVPYLTQRGTYIRNGHEMVMGHILRLNPGVYTRKKANGQFEAQVNVTQGTGMGFRVYMDPSNGVFNMRKGGVNTRLYPILRSMGVDDDALKASWGEDLLNANKKAATGTMVTRNLQKIMPMEKEGSAEAFTLTPDDGKRFLEDFGTMQVDPRSTELTLGRAHKNVTPDLLIDTTSKLLRIAQGKTNPDKRDGMEFQKVFGPADLFAERILKDGGKLSRNLLWKATNRGNIDFIQSGILNKHVDSIFNESKLAQYIDGSSPFDALDSATKITRIGTGGIGGTDTAPDEMRMVQPSFKGFVDPIRSPESLRAGLDMYMAYGAKKGSDGLLYNTFTDAKTGKPMSLSSSDAATANVATAEYMDSKEKYIPIVKGDGVKIVPREEVDYFMPDSQKLFSLGANMVPMLSGIKGMRLLMGSKYAGQSMPLVSREAPLVKSSTAEGGSIERKVGSYLGANKAKGSGVVKAVRKDRIDVEYLDGTKDSYELYDNFPANQKGYLRSTPKVKAGNIFKKGDILSTSNYTDDEGRSAMGTNLRTAYISWKGKNYEDAFVISASAAKKLTSEHMYHNRVPKDKSVILDKNKYLAKYPGKFTSEQFEKIGDDGKIKPGTVVQKGDPLILAMKENQPSPGTMGRRTFNNMVETWDHDHPGVITDVVSGKNHHMVYARANIPALEGDKISNRYGNKGVIAEVIPDDRMPTDKKGRAYDVLMSPLSVVSRTNPSQLIEVVMGKIAEKTGKAVEMPAFTPENYVDVALRELKKHNMSDTENLTDPGSGKDIPDVLTGNAYVFKLKHTAEAKESGRGTGGYTLEDTPSKGGYEGSKRFGNLVIGALAGHNAMEVLKDAKLIRGQSNDEFWRSFKNGETPVMPGEPLVHKKFFEALKGSGIALNKTKNSIDVFGMTNKELNDMTGGREVKNSNTFDQKHYRPMEGGLFGSDVFGQDGNQWGFIQLDEPVVNPIMTDSLRRILNMTKKSFEAIAEGREEHEGATGGAALKKALENVNLTKEINYEKQVLHKATGTRRSNSIKRFRALSALKEQKIRPEEFIFDRIPVLPPSFRQITKSGDMTMVADVNYLYKKVLDARDDLRAAKKNLPPEYWEAPRTDLYKAWNAVTGLADTDDTKLQQKNVGGLLKWVFGKGSPKHGAFQRKMIATSTDMVGRGTVTPNPALKLNQVGLPESQAWSIYEPFIVRKLRGAGYSGTDALKMVASKNKTAYSALQQAVKERPVMVNRAPTLHKFSIMGFWPVLTKGNTLQVSPSIVEPFGMDFDGDNANFHVPVSAKAAQEVVDKMMPEKNLLDVRGFKSHYNPIREYVQGIHLASRQKEGKPVHTFATKAEAVEAYKKGTIDVDDPIKIVGEK
jgi:DNA-directed RNA polymerase beta subunit